MRFKIEHSLKFGPHVAHECGGRIAWPIA
ncbi:uncharacterized protein METZ01_LOCUS166123, partial [marine metagenome]